MKKNIATLAAASALTLCMFTIPATAAGFYLGASVGQTKADAGSCDDFDDGSLVTCSIDDSDIGFKAYGGYRFNPHVAVEAGYADLGEASVTANSDGSGIYPTGALEGDIKAKGFLIQGMFGGNIHERVSLFATAGLFFSSVDMDVSAGGGAFKFSESASDTETKFGVGADIAINDRFSLRGEWERYMDVGNEDTGEGDVDLLSLGIRYQLQ